MCAGMGIFVVRENEDLIMELSGIYRTSLNPFIISERRNANSSLVHVCASRSGTYSSMGSFIAVSIDATVLSGPPINTSYDLISVLPQRDLLLRFILTMKRKCTTMQGVLVYVYPR